MCASLLKTVYPKTKRFATTESGDKISKFLNFIPEEKERAAIVDLEEFLCRQGEKLIKSGKEKRLASDHSVTINGCEWFDHATQTGGRAVSFVQKFYGKSYPKAISMLLGENLDTAYPLAEKREAPVPKNFAPPAPNGNMRRVFAYLVKTRGLDADVVSSFTRKKLIYEDAAHHNAVFLGTDEGGCPRHAHLRSTNSFGNPFRINVEGSNPRYSFHHIGTDGSLYVFEAPIDLLSYISLHPDGWQRHSYVACCGTSPQAVGQLGEILGGVKVPWSGAVLFFGRKSAPALHKWLKMVCLCKMTSYACRYIIAFPDRDCYNIFCKFVSTQPRRLNPMTYSSLKKCNRPAMWAG